MLARVTFPLYSRTEDMDHRSLRLRIVRLNATLIWPILACFIGDRAGGCRGCSASAGRPPSRPPQLLLAIAGMAATIRNGTEVLILAAGHPRAC
ncbi:MAG: hypothetical protein R2736_06955 [Solirubrobacterales bacterium]